MKNTSWIVLSSSLLALAMAPGACGGDDEDPATTGALPTTVTSTSAGAGGNGGSGATGTSVTTAAVTTTTTGGGPNCLGIVADNACGACLEAGCCQQISDCADDGDCAGCLDGSINDPATCNANGAWNALSGCADTTCATECAAPTSTCNPVTNEPCDTAAGEACDYAGGYFECYPAPNDQPICAACDSGTGPWCAGGMHCDDTMNKCTKFCCNDADCGTGTCDMSNVLDGVGTCTVDAGTTSCDAPATSPSGGSCFMPGQ